MKNLWFLLRPYQVRLWILGGLSIAIGYVESMQIAILYPILNATLEQQGGLSGNPFLNFLNYLASIIPVSNRLISTSIIFILLTVFIFITRYIFVNISVRTTAKVTIDYKEKSFGKFLRSDYQFFVDSRQGDLLYKAKGAPEAIAQAMGGLINTAVEIIVGLSMLVLMVSISWKATLLVAAVGASYYYFGRFIGYRISYTAGRRMRDSDREENVVLNEYITGVKQISASGAKGQWSRRFFEAVRAKWQAWTTNKIWQEIPPHAIELVLYTGVAVIIIVLLNVYPVDFYTMIPLFGTFAFAIFRLLPLVGVAGKQLMVVISTLPDLELTKELLADETYTRIKNGSRKFVKLESGVEFEDVSFTHSRKGQTTLKNISLNIKKDRITAVVGPSGAGKSTIINLFLRLFDVDSGAILIDGVDIREYDLASFLASVGFVSQETFIYNASVSDNITFGISYRPDEILEAAQAANADAFIQQMPQGYDTIVGDQGIRLSGGERQRIAIARAVIRKPQILVLDEATSSLDNVSERLVQASLDRVTKGCTTLVVAHRLSTIRNADMIYVIDNGRIIESGTHDELIMQDGTYGRLYTAQAGGRQGSSH